MATVRIEPYDRTLLPDTADVLGRAFERDTFLPSLLPGDRVVQRLTCLYAADLHRLGTTPQAIDLARADDGSLVGAALWLPPGSPGATVSGSLRALPDLLRALGPRLRQTMGVFGAIERARPTAAHWYLAAIGVIPEAEGTGVGTSLMRHGLARVDADHAPAYLEGATAGHADYYSRFGFEDLGPVDAPHPAPPVRMWRPAA